MANPLQIFELNIKEELTMTSYMSVDIPEETIEQSYLSPEIKSALKKHIEDNVFFRNLFVPNVGLQFVIGFKNRVGASIFSWTIQAKT